MQQVPENKYFLIFPYRLTPQSSINRGLMGKISRQEISILQFKKKLKGDLFKISEQIWE